MAARRPAVTVARRAGRRPASVGRSDAMRIVCVGGGPGGLMSAILLREEQMTRDVVVVERNGPDDAYGFGVVFSDETLENLRQAEPVVYSRIEAEFRHWTDIDVLYRSRILRSGGHGFAALSRTRLLRILADRARELGVDVRYHTEWHDVRAMRREYDLVVAADGVNSSVRTSLSRAFCPEVERGRAKYIWLGLAASLERFTFIFEQTPWGVVQAHAYPYDDAMSSFIVEMDRSTWERAGLGNSSVESLAPGESDAGAVAFCEAVFRSFLGGAALVGNNSRWLEFATVTNERWSSGKVVLIGDAAHTAHFSVGSGTKLAIEDAISLAGAIRSGGRVASALELYERERRPTVASTQRAAYTSRQWFENVARYVGLEPEPFAFQMLTRSQRVTYDNLRLRDPSFVDRILRWFWQSTTAAHRAPKPDTPPMFYPFTLRGLHLRNRVVVSPMAQYSATDGIPDDWHLVHLGSRAVGGAGLVMTEMTCVSPEGRITPGCTGLWNSAQEEAWTRIVEFVHRQPAARIGLQLGHSGRKGATKVPWEGEDEPLEVGSWEIVAPSPIAYTGRSQVPRELSIDDLEAITEQFVASAERGARAGFDLLELHVAHGYLLSSFLSPLTNRRTDEYGGSLANRMRFPLLVFDAVRATWPSDRPMSIRLSATDWVAGGFDGDDAVAVAVALRDHGCDIVDVSSGQVDKAERPRRGRLYQTPYSDRIRHEAGIPTMAVGGIASVDDANTIILAGRADLVVLARPHLVDPYWTLNAAIDVGYTAHEWPLQYLSGRTARRREQRPTAASDRDAP